MDMRWSTDPVESFKMFQSKISMEYERMRDKFGFVVIDAGRTIPDQQEEVRGIIRRKIDLRPFKHQQVSQT
jgi:dTMP kinase